jgi:hypothetical protein
VPVGCHRSRREVLAGASAVAATVAAAAVVPSLPTIKPDWLVAAELDLAADPWLDFNCFGPSQALTILNRQDGVDPRLYGQDREVRSGFASALSKGEATMAPDGRLFITDRGRKVWHAEWLDSYS